MDNRTEEQLAREAIDDLAERIRRESEELRCRGAVGDNLDRDLEEMMRQHQRIDAAIRDERSPAREMLDAEVAVLRSMFERWVASNERRFAQGSRRD